MYDLTCDLLYKKISERAKTMRDRHNLTLIDIYAYNPTMASYILRNKRTKNNPYLVPGKKFTNKRYVPYAKRRVYKNLLSDNNNISKVLDFDYDDDNDGEDFLNAISRLFLNVRDDFHKAYFNYFSDKTTIHLNNYISKFVHDEFIPMLSAYIRNDRSIGKTFFPIIKTVTEYLPNYVYDSIPDELITDSDKFQNDANNKLADSTFEYIRSLEIYQKGLEGNYNFEKHLNDNWTRDDCIKANEHS